MKKQIVATVLKPFTANNSPALILLTKDDEQVKIVCVQSWNCKSIFVAFGVKPLTTIFQEELFLLLFPQLLSIQPVRLKSAESIDIPFKSLF